MALAMSFDPGTPGDIVLNTHAIDILMGLPYVGGWMPEEQELLVGKAEDWADRWGRGTLRSGALIVETALCPDPRCEVDDLTRTMHLASTAGCVELEACNRERPTPDLMTAITPEGLPLASIHERDA